MSATDEKKPICWWQRRSLKVVGAFDAVCIAVIVAILTIPALAQTGIPIPGTSYVIDLGQLPPWIAVMIAAATFYEARNARMHAATAVQSVEVVRKQTDGLLDKVAAMSKIDGRTQERTEVAAAKEIVRTDAVADAEAAAKVRNADERK